MKLVTTAFLGEYLREARERRGLTQEALAASVGISRRTLGSIECGRTTDPAFSLVVRLAAVIGFSLDQLAEDVLYGHD